MAKPLHRNSKTLTPSRESKVTSVKRERVLDRRGLNRALLARQYLLERQSLSASALLEQLVGLQAQSPNPPYFALWSRLKNFTPEKLSKLISQRKAVRIALMRSTIHLVTAADSMCLRPLFQPVIERSFLSSTHGRGLANLDLAEVVSEARTVLAERPQTFAMLGEALKQKWPDREGIDLAYVARTYLPLVQVPPRGLWGNSGAAAHATITDWLGDGNAEESTTIEDCVLRYLGAFGPASVRDAQAWSGLTRLSEVFQRLRPKLVTFRDEAGTELFDLPRAPRPPAETPAPVRFLPEFDNLLLSHADRTRVIEPNHRKQLATLNGMPPGTVLWDGFVAGTWKIARDKKRALLNVATFAQQTKQQRNAIEAEGLTLLEFAAPKLVQREVTFSLRPK